VVLGPNEGKLLQVSDHPLIFKATKEDTNGHILCLEPT
jgi:hypothetical protein